MCGCRQWRHQNSESCCHYIRTYVSAVFCVKSSGCPDAVKVLVGNKCDLPADVDLSQAKVSSNVTDTVLCTILYILNCLTMVFW